MTDSCLSYRNPTNVCTDSERGPLEKFCSGCDGQVFEGDNWQQFSCPAVFSSILFERGTGNYDSSQIFRVQEDVNSLFEAWQRQGNSFQEPGSEGFSTFQNKLLQLCLDSNSTPGVCDNFLCNQVCGELSYEDLADFWGNWCGCYVRPPTNQEELYQNSIPVSAVSPNSDRGIFPCYPSCHQVDTVQLYDLDQGEAYTCSSNVCVIDSVVVEAASSNASINVSSICSQCLNNDSTCRCIVSSPSSDLIDNSAEQLEFNTICGENSICYLINDDSSLTAVDCSELVNSPEAVSRNLTLSVIILVVALVIIIIFFVWLISSVVKSERFQQEYVDKNPVTSTKSKRRDQFF
jgi:hypothetical protein